MKNGDLHWLWIVRCGCHHHVYAALQESLAWAVTGEATDLSEFGLLFLMVLAMPLIIIFLVFFAIGIAMDALGFGKQEKKKETELERLTREQMLREHNEKYRPRL